MSSSCRRSESVFASPSSFAAWAMAVLSYAITRSCASEAAFSLASVIFVCWFQSLVSASTQSSRSRASLSFTKTAASTGTASAPVFPPSAGFISVAAPPFPASPVGFAGHPASARSVAAESMRSQVRRRARRCMAAGYRIHAGRAVLRPVHGGIEFYTDRAVVRSHHLGGQDRGAQKRPHRRRRQDVIDAPAHVPGARATSRGPPAVPSG